MGALYPWDIQEGSRQNRPPWPEPGKETLCLVLCLGGRSLSTRQDRPVRWWTSGSVLGALTVLSPHSIPQLCCRSTWTTTT